MVEKVTIGDCDLYLGDCLEIIPTLGKVDAVITDPPYGANGGRRGGITKKSNKAGYETDKFIDSMDYVEGHCVEAIKQCIAISKRVALTCGKLNCAVYPRWDDMGAFYQPSSRTVTAWGFGTFQPILLYGKPHWAGKGLWPCTFRLTESGLTGDIDHPCPKPLHAWKWLLGYASGPGELVLDPFMGSGTTGVACVKMGRKFIGIEIEPKYFDIACGRIEEAHDQPDMLIPASKATQDTMQL